MWFIQTPVEALILPTDGVGRATLAGNVESWQHLVRDTNFPVEARSAVASMPIQWSVWPWQQTGRRVQLHESIAMHESLVEMVRANSERACVLARFPLPGKRQSDNTIELIVVVPPDQFRRYESLVQFAMTLPSGHVALTVPAPTFRNYDDLENSDPQLLNAGSSCVVEGLGLVVARARAQEFSKADVHPERRFTASSSDAARSLHDDGDEWLLFRADVPPAPVSVMNEVMMD